jgi:ceramide glucosyltransferase
MSLFSGLLMAASLAGTLYLFLAAGALRRFIRGARSCSVLRLPVTVLKPLHGDEAELYENLLSFCDQDYPACQIVFGVRDADDPAIAVVRRVMAARPNKDLALVVDGGVHGSNLKVSNLENMLAAAKHGVLVISDSDMRVRPRYLLEVTAPLDDGRVGLVTCLYRGRPVAGKGPEARQRFKVWSRLGAMFINHGFLPSALIGWSLHPGESCFGATMALRREALEAIGGFAVLRNLLADDYALGAAIRDLGREVALSPCLVDTLVDEAGPGSLIRHELRWSRTIRSLAPLGYGASVITQPVALALLALVLSGFTLTALGVFGIAMVCRLATVRYIDTLLGLCPTPIWLVPLRDLLSFGVFIASFCGNRIDWRGGSFRLAGDGSLVVKGDA